MIPRLRFCFNSCSGHYLPRSQYSFSCSLISLSKQYFFRATWRKFYRAINKHQLSELELLSVDFDHKLTFSAIEETKGTQLEHIPLEQAAGAISATTNSLTTDSELKGARRDLELNFQCDAHGR